MDQTFSKWRTVTTVAFLLSPCVAMAQTSDNANTNFDVTFPPTGGDKVVYNVVWSQPDPKVAEYDFSCADTCFINWTQSGIQDVFVKIEWSDDSSSGEYATTFNASADDLGLSWGTLPYNSVDEWSTKARYRWMFFPQYTPDNNGPNLLGYSEYFGINIKDWSYSKGTPSSSTGSTATQGASDSSSTSASNTAGSEGASSTQSNGNGSNGNENGTTDTAGAGSRAGSGQLSTTVKAVIAVVAVVVVLVVAAILFFVIRKRQRRKHQLALPPNIAEKAIDAPIGNKAELQGSAASSSGVPYAKAELSESSSTTHHGSVYADAKELDSRTVVVELPGDIAHR